MGVVELVLMAVGLAMDAFAVSVCKGLGMRQLNVRVALVLAALFGLFQGGMPVIGWLLGTQLLWLIEPFDHWIAFGLLAFIGGKMIADAVKDEPEESGATDRVAWGEFLMLAVATSIDALAVGLSLAVLNVNIVLPAVVIGVITFVLSLAGVAVGHAFGSRYERSAQIVGGVVLILIGLKVLLEHLGMAFWS